MSPSHNVDPYAIYQSDKPDWAHIVTVTETPHADDPRATIISAAVQTDRGPLTVAVSLATEALDTHRETVWINLMLAARTTRMVLAESIAPPLKLRKESADGPA